RSQRSHASARHVFQPAKVFASTLLPSLTSYSAARTGTLVNIRRMNTRYEIGLRSLIVDSPDCACPSRESKPLAVCRWRAIEVVDAYTEVDAPSGRSYRATACCRAVPMSPLRFGLNDPHGPGTARASRFD